MRREVLLVDYQIRNNRHDLRSKEYLVRKFLHDNDFENVRSVLGNLTRNDCQVVAQNTIGGKTLLYHAVKSKNRSLVSLLVECGANVDERLWIEDNCSVLMTAVKTGDFRMVLTLDKLRANLNIKDRKGSNALVHSLLKRQRSLAVYFKNRNVEINTSMTVHYCSKDLYYLEEALKLDFDVNFLGTSKNTLFILAACWGRMDVLKRLVAMGVDIYHRNSRGCHALSEALFHKKYKVIQFFMSDLYSVPDYIETLEFNGASDMIFENDFKFSFDCWVSALEMRKLFGYPRCKSSKFRDNIGEEYVSLDDLNRIGNDSLKLVLQALLIFLQVLSSNHPHVHNALATVASQDYLIDDYRVTLKILTELFTMHNVKADVIKSAGYKAMKSGLIVLERTVDIDVFENAEDAYFMRFELFFSFITMNVWSLLSLSVKTNITYYNCYRKYLMLVLDLLSLMYCEGIIAEQEPLLNLLLGVMVKKQIPFYPITILHVAVEKNYGLSIVNLLVKCGAQADVQDLDGNTPLDFASAYSAKHKNKRKIIQLLISAGADVKTVKSPRYRSHKIKNKRPLFTSQAKIIRVSLGRVSCSDVQNIRLLCKTLDES